MLLGRDLFAEHRAIGELPGAMEEGQALGERLMGAGFVDDDSGGFLFGEEGEAEQEEGEVLNHGGK
jgi:hypothetical protein